MTTKEEAERAVQRISSMGVDSQEALDCIDILTKYKSDKEKEKRNREYDERLIEWKAGLKEAKWIGFIPTDGYLIHAMRNTEELSSAIQGSNHVSPSVGRHTGISDAPRVMCNNLARWVYAGRRGRISKDPLPFEKMEQQTREGLNGTICYSLCRDCVTRVEKELVQNA